MLLAAGGGPNVNHLGVIVGGVGFPRITAGSAGGFQGRVGLFPLIGIVMGINAPRRVDAGGILHLPAGGQFIQQAGGAPHVANVLHGLARRHAVGDFHHGPLGIAVDQQIGLGIHQHRAADLVAPVVVMGNSAQAGLNTPNQNRGILVCLPTALGVDQHRAIRAFTPFVIGGIGVVVADFQIGGVAVDHGIHVARRHRIEQVGLAQFLEFVRVLPVRLSDDAHPKTL